MCGGGRQILAASASPHRHRFLQNKDKAPLCGTQAACSQLTEPSSFSIKRNLSSLQAATRLLKSEWVGGSCKAAAIKTAYELQVSVDEGKVSQN